MAITAKQAIDAAKDSKGIVTVVARRLGCSRRNVYKLMNKFATFREVLEEERESMKDFAEGQLFKQINMGNMTAIIFYLKTQAKDRGYTERYEIRTWQDEIITLLRDGRITPEDVTKELGDELASELFNTAGIRATQSRED